MCKKTSAFTKIYKKRCEEGACTRCGKVRDSSQKKCEICRDKESVWRKNTRSRRTSVERIYCQKNWDKRCVFQARTADKRGDRVIDEQMYNITPERLRTLRVYLKNKCFYCGTELQVENRMKRNGLTIERLQGGAHPHNCDNCIICCHRCNCARIGNKVNKDKSNLQIFAEIWSNFKL